MGWVEISAYKPFPLLVFNKDKKIVIAEDDIHRKRLFFPAFGEVSAVTLLLRFTGVERAVRQHTWRKPWRTEPLCIGETNG